MTKKEFSLNHFKNLIFIAFADGKLDEFEKQFLLDKAEDLNISRKDTLALIEKAHHIKFKLPESKEDREDELAEVVAIALVDGEMHPKEYELCLNFAKRLELSEDDLKLAIQLNNILWIKSPTEIDQINKFSNLVIVALADNKIDKEERTFLIETAQDLEIPTQEANNLINNSDNLKFTIPTSEEDKEEHLAEITYLALIDGNLHQKEYDLCYALARRIGFNKYDLDKSIHLAKKLYKHSQSV